MDSTIKWGAIGPATATAMEEWGIRADFVGTGEPNATAGRFLEVAKRQRVLFPRAAQSRQSIQRMLSEEIDALDLLVYQNTIDREAPLPEADILVFTSPLNARAYFERCRPGPDTKVIAIGEPTLRALQALGGQKIIMAKEPSEKGLAEAVWSVVR